MKVGFRIRHIRKSSNITVENFASILGISKKTIERYEKDEYQPSIETIELIANYFNISIGFFLGTEDEYVKNKFLKNDIDNDAMYYVFIREFKDNHEYISCAAKWIKYKDNIEVCEASVMPAGLALYFGFNGYHDPFIINNKRDAQVFNDYRFTGEVIIKKGICEKYFPAYLNQFEVDMRKKIYETGHVLEMYKHMI
jgi:transcriptional regulator with XRE-family HTH domain